MCGCKEIHTCQIPNKGNRENNSNKIDKINKQR